MFILLHTIIETDHMNEIEIYSSFAYLKINLEAL